MADTLKLVGQEITIFSKIYSEADFKNSDNIGKIVQEFIEEAESSSSSLPVLGVLDGELKNISSENSRLIDSENKSIEYKIKHIGNLIEPPSHDKILLVYYYLYLSSEYEIDFLKEMEKVMFSVNNFNNLAILSETNKDMDFQNNSADDSTDTYIRAILHNGKIFEYTQDDQEQLVSDLKII
tara:strand:- start:601 stop:1146 length:546 start_codon:yes stop_codon:yes gene_type:complete